MSGRTARSLRWSGGGVARVVIGKMPSSSRSCSNVVGFPSSLGRCPSCLRQGTCRCQTASVRGLRTRASPCAVPAWHSEVASWNTPNHDMRPDASSGDAMGLSPFRRGSLVWCRSTCRIALEYLRSHRARLRRPDLAGEGVATFSDFMVVCCAVAYALIGCLDWLP